MFIIVTATSPAERVTRNLVGDETGTRAYQYTASAASGGNAPARRHRAGR